VSAFFAFEHVSDVEIRVLRLGSGGFVWREALAGLLGAWGLWPPKLFDNFIGRKRDVDGGVLAGSLGFRAGRSGRDKLTVTFQTTIPVGPGFF
jgi:hypothetical protein